MMTFAHRSTYFLFNVCQAELKQSLELKRREAVWDLFQSESAFLRHHLMALKNVSTKEYHLVQNTGAVDPLYYQMSRSKVHGSYYPVGWRIGAVDPTAQCAGN